MRKIELSVVGIQHRTKQSLRYMLTRRLPLRVDLVREPRNPADPNAIMIVVSEIQKSKSRQSYAGLHLGYLRRGVAAEIAPKIDGQKLKVQRAMLTQLDPYMGEGKVEVSYNGKSLT